MSRKLILNVDTGVDDAMATMMAMSQCGGRGIAVERWEVVAVLCVAGNVGLEQVCKNTLQVVHVCGATEVPVYKGAVCSLLGTVMTPDPTYVHGVDGLGRTPHQQCTDEVFNVGLQNSLREEHAAQALVALSQRYPGEITLVSTASLTNIALALRLDPCLGQRLKNVIIMGGNTTGRGRVTPCAEFNFFCDPEAAYICLKDLHCPLTVVPYEVCLESHLSWDWVEKLLARKTRKGQFLKRILSHPVDLLRNTKQLPAYYTCDPLAMACTIDESVAVETVAVFCTVELQGTYSRGQMVVDWRKGSLQSPNVTLVKRVDVDKLKLMLENMVG